MAQGKKAPRGPLSMADRDGWIWYDGKLVPWRSATTHVLTHSLHYGLAVFEGVRAYKTSIGTAIYRLKEHTDRLFNSAKIYMMELPYSKEQVGDACRENGLLVSAEEDVIMIFPALTITRQTAERGLDIFEKSLQSA